MITAESAVDVALAATKELSDPGAHLVRHNDFSSVTGVSRDDWAGFSENREVLQRGPYMADGGTYRYHRYGHFELDMESGDLIDPHPHRRHEGSGR